jgi:hypothetical protein
MKPPTLLKNLPTPARLLFRPMLMISLVLHGLFLMLPLPSDWEKPPEQAERIRITKLPLKSKYSKPTSPQSSPKPASQPQPSISPRVSDRQYSVSASIPEPKLDRDSDILLNPKPNSDILQNSNKKPISQQRQQNTKVPKTPISKTTPESKKDNPETPQTPNPEPTPESKKDNPETPQTPNPEPTPESKKDSPETPQTPNTETTPSPSPNEQETPTDSEGSYSEMFNSLKPTNYLFIAVNQLKFVLESDLKKSVELENCIEKDNVFNCRLKTNSPTQEFVPQLQKVLENPNLKFQGFAKIESYQGTGTLYKAEINSTVSYFLITTDEQGTSTLTLSEQEPR